jgi:regulator of replication initiation timing
MIRVVSIPKFPKKKTTNTCKDHVKIISEQKATIEQLKMRLAMIVMENDQLRAEKERLHVKLSKVGTSNKTDYLRITMDTRHYLNMVAEVSDNEFARSLVLSKDKGINLTLDLLDKQGVKNMRE